MELTLFFSVEVGNYGVRVRGYTVVAQTFLFVSSWKFVARLRSLPHSTSRMVVPRVKSEEAARLLGELRQICAWGARTTRNGWGHKAKRPCAPPCLVAQNRSD